MVAEVTNLYTTVVLKNYRRELHRYFMRRLRQFEDVEDLEQELYLRLLRSKEDKVIQKPLAYAYGIASHVLADYRLEVEQRSRHVTTDSDIVDDHENNPNHIIPDDMAERLDLQQRLNTALAQLPSTHAAVIVLHKRDGLSYDEVAEKLNLSVHTVEKYVTQAKAALRMSLWGLATELDFIKSKPSEDNKT